MAQARGHRADRFGCRPPRQVAGYRRMQARRFDRGAAYAVVASRRDERDRSVPGRPDPLRRPRHARSPPRRIAAASWVVVRNRPRPVHRLGHPLLRPWPATSSPTTSVSGASGTCSRGVARGRRRRSCSGRCSRATNWRNSQSLAGQPHDERKTRVEAIARKLDLAAPSRLLRAGSRLKPACYTPSDPVDSQRIS